MTKKSLSTGAPRGIAVLHLLTLAVPNLLACGSPRSAPAGDEDSDPAEWAEDPEQAAARGVAGSSSHARGGEHACALAEPNLDCTAAAACLDACTRSSCARANPVCVGLTAPERDPRPLAPENPEPPPRGPGPDPTPMDAPGSAPAAGASSPY